MISRKDIMGVDATEIYQRIEVLYKLNNLGVMDVSAGLSIAHETYRRRKREGKINEDELKTLLAPFDLTIEQFMNDPKVTEYVKKNEHVWRRNCRDCGIVFETTGAKSFWCDDCLRQRIKRAHIAAKSITAEKYKKKRKKKSKENSLVDVAKKAREAGMSYGQYTKPEVKIERKW